MPDIRRASAACLAGILGLVSATGTVAQAVPVPAPAEQGQAPGFEVVVVGIMEGIAAEDFAQAVVAALPERLMNPETNFSRDAAYDPDRSYRLVIAFHGDAPLDPATLCRRPSAVEAEPLAPSDLMAVTHITGAFCEDEQLLSSASDRMVGGVEPGQAGFRFLVADVAKQLFPSGSEQIPGVLSAPAALPQE